MPPLYLLPHSFLHHSPFPSPYLLFPSSCSFLLQFSFYSISFASTFYLLHSRLDTHPHPLHACRIGCDEPLWPYEREGPSSCPRLAPRTVARALMMKKTRCHRRRLVRPLCPLALSSTDASLYK